MNDPFLDGVDARKARWRNVAAEAKGISAGYYRTGRGRDALEFAYGTAGTKPSTTVVREVWKQRHGRAAATLLMVIAYPHEHPQRAVVCGPAGDDPPAIEMDHGRAERLAATALAELGVLAEARIGGAVPVAPTGQDGAQEPYQRGRTGHPLERSPLPDTGAPLCVHDVDGQQMLAGPLGEVRTVRAVAMSGLGSGQERVQPMPPFSRLLSIY